MKTFQKVLKWFFIIAVLLAALLITFVLIRSTKKFEAPLPTIISTSDSTVIAKGKYLAYGPAHCATCHVPMNKIMDVENGEQIPLSGGGEIEVQPFGTFRAPNLTPDVETGIGAYSDGQLARALRYGVAHDQSILFPFMPFQEMSDEDLTAVISFIRSQPPVKNKIEKSSYRFLGKALIAFGFLLPEGFKKTPEVSVRRDTIKEYGDYLTHHIANCVRCHTAFDENTGKFTGEPFSGGATFAPDVFSNGRSFVSPNLTPDPETGIISSWDEEAFVRRFRSGRVHEGSPMPWGAFSRMDELDLRSIYRYLKSLDPVKKKIPKVVYEAGESIPKNN